MSLNTLNTNRQDIGAVGERERGIAAPGIHNERETLAGLRLALFVDSHQAVSGGQMALSLQPQDAWVTDAQGAQPVREHPPLIRSSAHPLDQPVADGWSTVRQRLALHRNPGSCTTVPSADTGRSRRFTTSRDNAVCRSRASAAVSPHPGQTAVLRPPKAAGTRCGCGAGGARKGRAVSDDFEQNVARARKRDRDGSACRIREEKGPRLSPGGRRGHGERGRRRHRMTGLPLGRRGRC